jgi:hypothetical protein
MLIMIHIRTFRNQMAAILWKWHFVCRLGDRPQRTSSMNIVSEHRQQAQTEAIDMTDQINLEKCRVCPP